MQTNSNVETTVVQESARAQRAAGSAGSGVGVVADNAAATDTTTDNEVRTPRELAHEELARCAGWLAREAGRRQGFAGRQWRAHWDDLHQTALLALLALLEQGDRPLGYAITAARNALRNYVWVHVKGLNGGWKSLAGRDYTVIETSESIDADEKGEDNLSWRLGPVRRRELVARPVEWAVLGRERLRECANGRERLRERGRERLRERANARENTRERSRVRDRMQAVQPSHPGSRAVGAQAEAVRESALPYGDGDDANAGAAGDVAAAAVAGGAVDPVLAAADLFSPEQLGDRRRLETADLFRQLLVILVGMSGSRWYPEQMYRGALVVAMRLAGHPWEEVMAALGDIEHENVVHIYQEYRAKYLLPYGELALPGRMLVVMRGRLRVQWFEQLDEDWLRRPQRKIVVFPHGIYTITYKLRKRSGKIEAALQKGRRVDGRVKVRQVHLGRAEELTPAKLWERSLALERKLGAFMAEGGNQGRIQASRQVMFGVV